MKLKDKENIKLVIYSLTGACVLTLLLSLISKYDVTSLSFFSPTEKSIDFQSSDFYQLVANSRNERYLDDKIVLVPIDGLSRTEIGALLEDIELCNPAVVGFDIYFQFHMESDSKLLETMKRMDNLMYPSL